MLNVINNPDSLDKFNELLKAFELLDQRVQAHWEHTNEIIEKYGAVAFSQRLDDIESLIPDLQDLRPIEYRLDQVEKYLNHNKFHKIIGDLHKLENEFSEKAIEIIQGIAKNKEEPVKKNILNKSIHELDLTNRAIGCLQAEGINTIGDLVKWKRHELFRTPNLGNTTMKEIENQLKKAGLKLGMKHEAE